MLGRASNPEALGFLSGEVSLASKPEELLIAIARRCRKLIEQLNMASVGITNSDCWPQAFSHAAGR